MWFIVSIPLLAAVSPVVAQTISNAHCANDTSVEWTFNSVGQSPCDVAADLGGVCTGGEFTIQPLQPDFLYGGPDLDNANSCRCSSVYYSMLSACAVCQGRDVARWSFYSTNCTTAYVTVFFGDIPPGTRVPDYAYQNVTIGDAFNTTLAAVDKGLESTNVPSATNTNPGTPTSTANTHSSKIKAGPIAGGVIGGVVGLALLAGIVFLLFRRKRTPKPEPTTAYESVPAKITPMAYNDSRNAFSPMVTPKLYDPADPSTFPTSPVATEYTTQTNEPTIYSSSMHNLQGPGPRYTGAPEL